jgi:dCMP deaminase
VILRRGRGKNKMSKIIVAYIPVLHEGYRKFLECHKKVKTLYLWGENLFTEADYLSKEIRALDPKLMKKSLAALALGFKIKILTKKTLNEVISFKGEIIMPDDDISHTFNEKFLNNKEVIFANIFLRWEKRNSVRQNKIANDQVVTINEFSRKMIALAEKEAGRSSDWWRHVGAVLVKEGKIISTGHNVHLPSEHTPYVNGDPRNCFHKGEHLDLSTAIHAEAKLIAEAAKEGISLTGAEIYVTTFPCPPCAKMIAYSGIKKIYYKEGYGVLDGESVLKDKGVEIFFVQ